MNAPLKTAWEVLAKPPKDALKQIKGGRLSGMTDINPQWRYKAMHDVYGPCGIGWKYQIDRVWTEPGAAGQVFMFAQVSVTVSQGGSWSEPIPGIGGSMLLEMQKGSLHHNDEAVKMATTDALSVALKMLGVGADIYMGRWDGSKYKDETPSTKPPVKAALEGVEINPEDMAYLRELASELVHRCEVENHVADAYDAMTSAQLDSDQKLQLWELLAPNSKTRSALKKEGELRRKLAQTQPTEAERLAGA